MMICKKILIFSLAYHPYAGGAEIAIKEITDRISPEEFSFDMITFRLDANLPRFEQISNVNVHRIGFSKKAPRDDELTRFPLYLNKIFFPVTAFLKAISLDRKNKYSAIWSVITYMGFPAVFFKFFYKPKIPFILTIQDGDTIADITHRIRIRLVYPLFLMIFKKADFVQTISTYLGDFARSMGYAGSLKVVHNGVDIEKFKAKSEKRKIDEKLRKDLKLTDRDRVIITTSRLVKKNAVDDVIKSLRFLPVNVKFLVIGGGPDEKKLRELAANEGVKGRVIFMGPVEHKNIPQYLHIADIFIRPSLSEGMGISFIEAMAAGVPVVATMVGGITDFLKDKNTGFVCGVREPKSISEQIEYILDEKNKEKVRDVIARAKTVARKEYGWDSIAKEMQNIFRLYT